MTKLLFKFFLSPKGWLWLFFLLPIHMLATVGDDFTFDGILYTILDEDAKTVETKQGYYTCGNIATGELIIPDIVYYGNSPYTVVKIGCYSFYKQPITSLKCGNNITSIEEFAFSGCSSLTNVEFGNSLISIGYASFYDCSSLVNLDFGNALTTIGKDAFNDCSSLRRVVFGDSLTSIGYGAFYFCTSIESLEFGDSLIFIGDQAFFSCSSLTSVKFGEALTSIGTKTFYNCTSLASVKFGEALTSIGSSAFSNCISLTSLKFGEALTSIDSSAFSNCTSITSVEFGEALTSIGKSAFSNCSLIKNVILPSKIEIVKEDAFYGCSPKIAYPEVLLSSSNLGNGIKVSYPSENSLIADGMVWGLDKSAIWFAPTTLEGDFKIPSTVKDIGNEAFNDCSSLISVEFGEALTSICDYAFRGCTSLSNVILPSKLESVGKDAFKDCKLKIAYPAGLSTDNLGNNVKVSYPSDNSLIADGMVWGYDKAAIWFVPTTLVGEFIIPQSVTEIGENAFTGCDNINSIIAESIVAPTIDQNSFEGLYDTANLYINENSLISYLSRSYWLQFKNIFSGVNRIETADDEVFRYVVNSEAKEAYLTDVIDKNITNASIPNRMVYENIEGSYFCNVIIVAANAFSGMSNLKSVKLSDNLTTIGDYAFKACTQLTTLNLPNGLITIGNGAFEECSNLGKESTVNFLFPESLTTIGNYAFYNCQNIIFDKNFPSGLISIGDDAFYKCYGLEELILPNSLKSIGSRAFRECRFISIEIPNSILKIGSEAFGSCKNMSDFKIVDNLEPIELGNSIVDGSSVQKIYIGRNFTGEAFKGCNMKSLVLGNLVSSIPVDAFSTCKFLETMKLGSALTEIPEKAFYDCSRLTDVVVPANVTSIGERAFAGCNLKNVSIGYGMTSIGEKAFYDNNNISAVNMTAITPPDAYNNSFSYYEAPLYVPSESVDAYYNFTRCWYRFNTYPLVVADGLTLTLDEENSALHISASILPEDASLPFVFFRSANPEIATVDNDGNVKFINPDNSEICEIFVETLYADGPVVSIKLSPEGNGIDNIIVDGYKTIKSPNDIYTLQGICLKRNVNQDDINTLSPGVYIIAGKKVMIK